MELHKLPKDILIEIIKKNYDFTKLSIDQVENVHSEISKRAKARYHEEWKKNQEILETRHNDFCIQVYCDAIRIGHVKIKLHYKRDYDYELKYYNCGRRIIKLVKIQEDLIQYIIRIFKDTDSTRVDEFISIIKTYIKALQDNHRIEEIISLKFVFLFQ